MNPRSLQLKSDQIVTQGTPDSTSRSQTTSAELKSPANRQRKSVSAFERWLVLRMLRAVGNPDITLVLWTGEQIHAAGRPAELRLFIRDRRTLWRLLLDPEYQFGESYSNGRLDFEGDFIELINTIKYSLSRSEGGGLLHRLLNFVLHRPHRNSLSGSQSNIHHHYDIGNDFYKLWLDDQLLYTCAYFPEPDCTLEEAQVAKMDHVCRKLQLKPGQKVIEAGCGWGALSLHMARHYGVTVRAYNISREQVSYARNRAEDENLDDRVEFVLDDWRKIRGECDRFVSVGMLEHVGRKNYRLLGDVIDGCLNSDGFAFIHSIGQNQPRPFDPWTEKRIFPGAYPPALREMMEIFEANDFSVLDVENIRLHYAETIRHWLDRYERAVETVQDMFDDRFVRMWRLYLAGSVSAFETGNLQLFQILFARGQNNHVPRTREYIYEDEGLMSQVWSASEADHAHSDTDCRSNPGNNGNLPVKSKKRRRENSAP